MGGLWIIHKIIMAMPQTLTPRAIFSLYHPLIFPFSPPNFPFLTTCFFLSYHLFFPFISSALSNLFVNSRNFKQKLTTERARGSHKANSNSQQKDMR